MRPHRGLRAEANRAARECGVPPLCVVQSPTCPVRSLTAARCASGSPRAAWSFLRRPLATPRDGRDDWPSQRLLTVGPGRRVLSRKFGIGRRKAPALPEFVLGVEPFEPLARATLSLRHFRISKLYAAVGIGVGLRAQGREILTRTWGGCAAFFSVIFSSKVFPECYGVDVVLRCWNRSPDSGNSSLSEAVLTWF